MAKYNSWKKYFYDLDKINNPSPGMVELDLTNYCNAKCSWCCAWREMEKPKKNMSLMILARELGYAIGRKYGIVLTGGGEPTLHPQFRGFVDVGVGALKEGLIPAFCLVSNGILYEEIRYFVENTSEPKSWVRLSLNNREIPNGLYKLFKKYPKRIGVSLIYGNKKEREGCEKNRKLLKKYAKNVRMKQATDYKTPHPTVNPQNCIGKKLHRLVESDGLVAFCCQARGMDGEPPEMCPIECRWAVIDMNEIAEENPFS